jgi:rubredoxin
VSGFADAEHECSVCGYTITGEEFFEAVADGGECPSCRTRF